MIRIERDYWKNGKLRFEHPFVGDKWCGTLKGWYENGERDYEHGYQNDILHGPVKGWDQKGRVLYEDYYLYGNQVSKEEYHKHQLITKLAGIDDGSY